MKRILCMILCLLFLVVCMLFGCSQTNPEEGASYILASSFYAAEDSSFAKQHYVEQAIEVDLFQAAANYVDNAPINGGFVTAYEQADRIEALPVYGDYLEPTNMAIYLFLKGENTLGIAEAILASDGTIKEERFRNLTEPLEIFSSLSLEHCYNSLVSCLQDEYFTMTGIVYATQGYGQIYPVGTKEGSTILQYWAGAPRSFLLVDPFETVEQGRYAFQLYLEQKNLILNNIAVFPWKTEPFYEAGYLSRVPVDSSDAFLLDYDSQLAIPILDELHQEGRYILHLLYLHNQLIAGLVIEQKTASDYEIVWKNVAPKDSNGSYIPLKTSTYESLLQESLSKTNWLGQTVAGIAYKGQLELVWQW